MQPPIRENPPSRPVRKPGMIAKIGLSWKLLVHLAIIAGLVFAIRIAWENYGKAQQKREKAEREAVAAQAAERERALAEARQRQENRDAQQASSANPPVVRAVEPAPESPAQALLRLRDRLASGDRSEYPPGAVVRGDSVYWFSGQSMTWPEAAWFAEQHGGHLAYPNSSAVLAWLQAEVAQGNAIWIGAAKSGSGQWSLADGTPWTPATEPPGTGIYLGVSREGRLATPKPGQALAFVIQWRADGSNPAALIRVLQATQASLDSNKPAFPPGTQQVGGRRYLAVHRPVTWHNAVELAKSAGGHLAVASAADEMAGLEGIARDFPAPEGLWMGAFERDGQWLWVTGEPWNPASWMDGMTKISNAALTLHPGTGMDATPLSNTASGFIIEWSADRSSKPPPASGATTRRPENTAEKPAENAAALSAEHAELSARARDLLAAAIRKRDEQLAANARDIDWNLDAWLRSLVRSEQDTWIPQVNRLKKSVRDNRVPSSLLRSSEIEMSGKMMEVTRYAIEKQVRIDAAFRNEATRIRDAYVNRLRESIQSAQTAGRNADAQSLTTMLDDAADLDVWLRAMDLDP